MKKTSKILAVVLAALLVVAAVAVFAACDQGETYDGVYSYYALEYDENSKPVGVSTTHQYGVKVHVTVKGGVIMSVTADEDTDAFYNLTTSWSGKQTWIDGQAAFLASFKGLTVEQVKAISVAVAAETNLDYYTPAGQPSGITGAPAALKVVSGATQSTGRVILAVQDALSKIPAAE